MSADKPLVDKAGQPTTIWSSIKWNEVKEKKEKNP